MNDKSSLSQAASFWDRETITPSHSSWMEHPSIREYINGNFGNAWPLDWFEKNFPGRRFARALSVGCGTGALERDLVRRGICDQVVAFDASIQSLQIAEAEARAEGFSDRISYFAGDFNRPSFPAESFDAVFCHQSVHHVAKLEKLFASISRSLRPGGLFYLDEYVGPSRNDWSDDAMRDARRIHGAIPEARRRRASLGFPIQEDDPSEAIRSGEILSQLRIGFRIIAEQGYGGNVLSVLYPEVRWDEEAVPLLDTLIAEDAAVAEKEGPYYSIIVAERKLSVAGVLARQRYFVEPKLRRVRLEILRRLGRDAKF